MSGSPSSSLLSASYDFSGFSTPPQEIGENPAVPGQPVNKRGGNKNTPRNADSGGGVGPRGAEAAEPPQPRAGSPIPQHTELGISPERFVEIFSRMVEATDPTTPLGDQVGPILSEIVSILAKENDDRNALMDWAQMVLKIQDLVQTVQNREGKGKNEVRDEIIEAIETIVDLLGSFDEATYGISPATQETMKVFLNARLDWLATKDFDRSAESIVSDLILEHIKVDEIEGDGPRAVAQYMIDYAKALRIEQEGKIITPMERLVGTLNVYGSHINGFGPDELFAALKALSADFLEYMDDYPAPDALDRPAVGLETLLRQVKEAIDNSPDARLKTIKSLSEPLKLAADFFGAFSHIKTEEIKKVLASGDTAIIASWIIHFWKPDTEEGKFLKKYANTPRFGQYEGDSTLSVTPFERILASIKSYTGGHNGVKSEQFMTILTDIAVDVKAYTEDPNITTPATLEEPQLLCAALCREAADLLEAHKEDPALNTIISKDRAERLVNSLDDAANKFEQVDPEKILETFMELVKGNPHAIPKLLKQIRHFFPNKGTYTMAGAGLGVSVGYGIVRIIQSSAQEALASASSSLEAVVQDLHPVVAWLPYIAGAFLMLVGLYIDWKKKKKSDEELRQNPVLSHALAGGRVVSV